MKYSTEEYFKKVKESTERRIEEAVDQEEINRLKEQCAHLMYAIRAVRKCECIKKRTCENCGGKFVGAKTARYCEECRNRVNKKGSRPGRWRYEITKDGETLRFDTAADVGEYIGRSDNRVHYAVRSGNALLGWKIKRIERERG